MSNVVNLYKPLLSDQRQADRALRDLMPVIECLTNATLSNRDPSKEEIDLIIKSFKKISPYSPAIKAFMNWLDSNTKNSFPPEPA